MQTSRFALLIVALGSLITACPGPTPAPQIASIQISAPSTTLDVAGTQTVTAIAKDGSGNTIANPTLIWTSGDPSKARVQNAVVTGVADGDATVTASSGNITSNPIVFNVGRAPVVIPATTEVIPSATAALISSVSPGGTVRFEKANATTAGFQVGDVLVSAPTGAAPDGLLRKVTAVRQEASEVIVETAEATLLDAVSSGEAEGMASMNTANLRSAQALRPGVRVQSRALARPQAQILNLEFNRVLFDADGKEETTNDQIEVSGGLKLDVNLEAKIKVSTCWDVPPVCLKLFRVAVNVKETAQLKVRGDFEKAEQKEYPVAEYEFDPVVLQIGPVPVVLNPKVTAFVRLDGKATARLRWEVTQTATTRLGVEYSDEKWKGIKEFDSSFTNTNPEISASVNMRAETEGRFDVKLYGSDSNKAWVRANLWADLDVLANRNPTWKLKGGASAHIGAQAKVLGIKLGKYEAKIFDFEKDLASGNIPGLTPDAPTISSIDPSPLNFSGFNGGDVIERNLTFRNRGRGALTYELKDVPAWLEVLEGRSGTLSEDQEANVKLRTRCQGQDSTATLKVTSNAANGAEKYAYVYLQCVNPSIKLTLAPVALKSLRRGSSDDTLVRVERLGFEGPINLQLLTPPREFSSAGATIAADSSEAVLKITTGGNADLGRTALLVRASSGNVNQHIELIVNVTVAPTKGWLLVDNDQSPNNWDSLRPEHRSASDNLFRETLTGLGIAFEEHIVKHVYNRPVSGPNFEALLPYAGVIWYTGEGQDFNGTNLATISSTDESNLAAYVSLGGRKLQIHSQGYARGLSGTFGGAENAFVADTLGLIGAKGAVITRRAFVATGVAETVTNGMRLDVAAQQPLNTDVSVYNPGVGTDALLNVPAELTPSVVTQLPAVTGRKRAGFAQTSTAIMIGLPVENIVDISGNSRRALLERLFSY